MPATLAEPEQPLAATPSGRKAAASGAPPCFPPLTRSAWRLLALLALLFATFVACRFNGSSCALWANPDLADIRPGDAPVGLLLSTPKQSRADEWNVWTPAMLNQARQQPSFPAHNATLGPGVTPLLMSLPARHYTMAFRPQLWGFFALPFEYAFSWYWNVKVFGLFAAMFLLCWVLTDGQFGWSVFGAVAIQFSPFMQWWFSTPTMLPEMLTAWALGIVAALCLFLPGSGGGWRRHALAMGGLVVCGVNFMLCCYPAFEVPLLHAGFFVIAGYGWQRRIFSRRGALLLAGALVLTALVLVPWLLDCLPTLRIEAQTVYPGQRHVYGGDMKVGRYLSGLLNLAMTEERCPPKLLNVCEAANFFPLWLLPLGLGIAAFARFAGSRPAWSEWKEWLAARGLKVALAAYLAWMTVYMFVRLPHWLASLTLIDRSYGRRCIVGVGVAGVLLLVLSLAEGSPRAPGKRAAWTAGLAWAVGVLVFLAVGMVVYPDLLGFGNTAALAAVAWFLGAAYLRGPRWLLPVGWAAIFVSQTAFINPLCIGLPEMLESPMLNELRGVVRAHPEAEWAVYDSGISAELIKTTGARVVNGLRIVPDPELIHRLDPFGKNRSKYNRYSNLCFTSAPYEAGVLVSLSRKVFCNVGIHPLRLRECFPKLRFLVSTREVLGAEGAGFRLVGHVEANHLWLYGLPMMDGPVSSMPVAPVASPPGP